MIEVPDNVYLGLKVSDIATIAAVIVGPIAAVVITLFNEARRRTRELQTQTLRMLISTRHLPGDASYNTAINLIPVDFNREQAVMKAWSDYIEIVRYAPAAGNEETHNRQMSAKQTTLIFEIMKFLKYDLSETQIQQSAYAAGGFTKRDEIWIRAQLAWPEIAQALQRQNELTERLVSGQATSPVPASALPPIGNS